MKLVEGTLVVVLEVKGLKNFIRDKMSLAVGTYIGIVDKDKVQVLLPNGYIFTGGIRDICPEAEQI